MTALGSITLAVAVFGIVLSILLWIAPGAMRRGMRAFPRHTLSGCVLSAVALVWAAWLLYHMPMGILDPYKPALLGLTPLTIGLTWYYLDELLAVRALGGILLLIPAPWLAAARLHPSPWSAVASGCAYLMVLKGLLLVLSPYQFRRLGGWWLESDARLRVARTAGLVLDTLLAVLAVAVYG